MRPFPLNTPGRSLLALAATTTVITALLAATIATAHAQGWPQRPVRMIVPFAAGGTTDTIGRVVAQYLGERLGQSMVVENRGGGGGTVGAEVGARAQPDGYTVLLGSAEAYGMTHAILKRLPYNPEKDLVPVTMVSRAPNCFAVHPSIKATTLRELIDYARANPGRIRFGSPGVGSNPHLIGELLKARYGIDIQHVPYKGGGASIIDVMSGQIEMIVTGLNTAGPRHKAGQIRALANTGSTRTPLMPDVPTMAEAGVEDFVLGALFGVFVPVGTPQEVVARLARELTAISQLPEFRKRLIEVGQEVTEPLSGDAFGRYISGEARRWRELAEKAGVKDE
ncbi:MAG: tripartite tricarboxylate transporter substrate binding protein [Betaproteobacteria bacterium]|nr:tripartite tricarboxylate transporter substrate binding protein [Betaproteobacteria bacterium]